MALRRLCLARPIVRAPSPFYAVSFRSMTTQWADQNCVPCSKKAIRELGLQRLTPDETQTKLQQLEPGWTLMPQPQIGSATTTPPNALQKVYKFRNFATASEFASAVGKEADAQGHHPAILLEWGSVGVWWWSHALEGVRILDGGIFTQLHDNDFIMASRTDRLAASAPGLKA